MRLSTVLGAILYLTSTTLAFPLSLPHVAHHPSTSVVERRWDPISLLRRALPSRNDDKSELRVISTATKGMRYPAYSKNPVVKSLLDLAARDEPNIQDTKIQDFDKPEMSTASAENPESSGSDLNDPVALGLSTKAAAKNGDKYSTFGGRFWNSAMNDHF
ncbi:MAG: hypothetical protein Q9221_004955 [Calogaya cf. arnoldii]